MVKRLCVSIFSVALCLGVTVGTEAGEESMDNPFFGEWTTPFQAPPFDQIEPHHFMPAFERTVAEHRAEIAAIVENPDPPTFANSIEALERAGSRLSRMRAVLMNLNSAEADDAIREVVRGMAPLYSAHRDDILLNQELFARIDAVRSTAGLDLTGEQRMLLEETWTRFVRGGVRLVGEQQQRLREINERLSQLTVEFGENLLEEMNSPALVIDREEDLEGLSSALRAAAAQVAEENGLPGKWAFTLQRTSWTPFLEQSPRRELREKLYTAYMNLCNHDGEHDNRALAAEIAALRQERAELLGYATHAHYVLERSMAESPERVFALLDQVWEPAIAKARHEASELQEMIAHDGGGFELAPWDWWFYAEKVRAARYDFDAESLKPYFVLENVRDGAFAVANRLWGISFLERRDVPVYHPDVRAFEVTDRDGSHLGLFYVDYFTRSSKRGGAWMNNFRDQSKLDGKEIRPIVANVCNFTKPAAGEPALLSLDEVRTLFHEFGHGLHGLLADRTYESLSGTNVYRDFVEIASQMMENWALAPEVLGTYALHYETGEAIPDELVEKMKAAETFNQGFATTEYLAASYLDMKWHTMSVAERLNAPEFEQKVLGDIGLIPEIISRYRSTYFSHIFAGGYSAGYYSYLWAEVLEADGFEAFRRAGIFDPEVARSYRENILEAGGTEPPMELYVRFRGAEPSVTPLLERRGLLGEPSGSTGAP